MLASFTRGTIRLLDRVLPKGRRDGDLPAHHRVERRGEEEAYFYLRKHGYVIVARNYRSARRRGEIDLVGWDRDVLCFVEVKTRTSRDVKPAEAAVDREKRRELGGMARDSSTAGTGRSAVALRRGRHLLRKRGCAAAHRIV